MSRLSYYEKKELASYITDHPDELESLKEMGDHYYNYAAAVLRNIEIKKWCKEQDFQDFDILMETMRTEKPEWYASFNNSTMSKIQLINWFLDRMYEEKIKQARKIARGGKPNTRKAKPVICLDNGMEFGRINQAAKWMGYKRTHDISDCCYGIISDVRGFHFRFKEDDG